MSGKVLHLPEGGKEFRAANRMGNPHPKHESEKHAQRIRSDEGSDCKEAIPRRTDSYATRYAKECERRKAYGRKRYREHREEILMRCAEKFARDRQRLRDMAAEIIRLYDRVILLEETLTEWEGRKGKANG